MVTVKTHQEKNQWTCLVGYWHHFFEIKLWHDGGGRMKRRKRTECFLEIIETLSHRASNVTSSHYGTIVTVNNVILSLISMGLLAFTNSIVYIVSQWYYCDTLGVWHYCIHKSKNDFVNPWLTKSINLIWCRHSSIWCLRRGVYCSPGIDPRFWRNPVHSGNSAGMRFGSGASQIGIFIPGTGIGNHVPGIGQNGIWGYQ